MAIGVDSRSKRNRARVQKYYYLTKLISGIEAKDC